MLTSAQCKFVCLPLSHCKPKCVQLLLLGKNITIICREPYKALDCFFEVVHGLGNEEFLIKLLNVASEISVTHLEILYYLKV